MANKVEIEITADDLTGPAFDAVLAKLAELKAAAKALGGDLGSMGSPDINASGLTAQLTNLKSKIQSVGIADIADVNVPTGRLMTQLQLLKRLIQQVGISDMLDINLNQSELTNQLQKLHGLSEDIPVRFNIASGALFSQLAALKALMGSMGGIHGPSFPNYGGDPVTVMNRLFAAFQKTAGAAAELNQQAQIFGNLGHYDNGVWYQGLQGIDEMYKRLTTDTNEATGGGGKGMLGLIAASGIMTHVLNTQFTGWTAVIGGIGLWHIILDGAIEGAIIAISTLAALGATVEALGGTFVNLYTHLEAVYQVNSALGSHIQPLTDRFVALQKALAPQGIEIYGAALNMINMQAGAMGNALAPVVNLWTTFAAKIVLWEKGFGSTGLIFKSGIGFLGQLGGILGTLGQSIGNLIKATPGIAHMLLDLIQGLFSAFKLFTEIPRPLLEVVLGLHGLYVWGSVLSGLFAKLLPYLKNFFMTLIAFGTNPFAWAYLAAAALLYLGYEATQADGATKKFINDMNAGLQQLSGQDAFQKSIADMGALNRQINATNWQNIASHMDLFHQVMLNLGYSVDQTAHGFANLLSGHIFAGLANMGHAFSVFFTGGNDAFGQQARNNIDAYIAEEGKLLGQQKNMIGAFVKVYDAGYTVSQSWALLTLAGVKMGDSVAIAYQKVLDLISGYKGLGVSGGILANSVNAITFQQLQQQSQISALTGAWSNFFSLIQSGAAGFDNFILGTMRKAAPSFQNLAAAMKATHGNLGGLSAAQLSANQVFLNAAQNAQTEMNNLLNLSSAAAMGTKGTDMLTQATKDMLTQLLPAAKHSQTLTTVLYALAQQGGYRGADSFKALSQWVGKPIDPMKQLQRIVQNLTFAAGNLNTDVKNLSDALGKTLTAAMSEAMFAASGGQGVFDKFAAEILKTGTNSKGTKTAADHLAVSLLDTTGNATQAKNEFFAFAEKLGATRSQANQLWQNALPSLQNEINRLHGKNLDVSVTAIATGSQAAWNILLNHPSNYGLGVTVPSNAKAGGGIIPHAAGGGWRNGWTLVGEMGPELVNLPAGSRVYSNGASQQMMGGSQKCNHVVTLNVKGGDREFKNMIRGWVEVDGGGDVQAAFGTD